MIQELDLLVKKNKQGFLRKSRQKHTPRDSEKIHPGSRIQGGKKALDRFP
jgi:hypothetical protein